MSTSVQQALAQLQAAQGDPQKLALATLDIVLSSQRPELRQAFEAAAVPHWFTKSTLGKLLDVDDHQATEYLEQLQRLPMVETFSARQAWNVHEATRLALRAQLAAEKPEEFRQLSTRAAAFFTGDQPHDRIERLFHLFGAQSPAAEPFFDELWNEWHPSAPDNVLALGAAILELDIPPSLLTDKSGFLYELAWRYIYLSDTAAAFGQGQQAQTYVQRSAAILEKLVASAPAQRDFSWSLAVSYERMGDLARDHGQSVLTTEHFEKSHAIRSRLAEAEPDGAGVQRELSVSLDRLGNLARDQGRSQAAQSYFEQSLAIIQRLAQAEPNHADLQRDLSISFENLGDLARDKGQSETAQSYFEQALAIHQRLALAEPNLADLQRDLSVSFTKLGDLARDQGQSQAAQSYFEKDLAIAQRLAQAEPNRADLQRDLFISFWNLGDLALHLGQSSAAETYFQQSLGTLQSLKDSGRMNPIDERHLDTLRERIQKAKTAGHTSP